MHKMRCCTTDFAHLAPGNASDLQKKIVIAGLSVFMHPALHIYAGEGRLLALPNGVVPVTVSLCS